MTLDDLRRTIDRIDDELLSLLEQRARTALEIAAEKGRQGWVTRYDPERERALLERLVDRAELLPKASIRAIFREIVASCLALQKPLSVAFLGPEGTFSHQAARGRFGDAAEYLPCQTIEQVFDALARGAAARGVVPRENSAEGPVAATVRGLLDRDIQIERELVVRVSHCLLSSSPALDAVSVVYSHPQALAQCGRWLAQNLPRASLVATDSTAAAAQRAASEPGAAAVASRLAGELHGLAVLAPSIEDEPDNATRFLVLGPADAARTGDDRTSLAFELPDRPGALRAALIAFDEAGVNLTKLESLPSRKRPWSYVFLCDLEGHRDDAPVAQAIEKLRASTSSLKLLGSYPRTSAR